MADFDPARLEAAGARFVAFFNELGRNFVEREELLAQVALGLLSREHVLMTGPPGTAKSGIASAVLRRVIDERTGLPSLFARQFTESTVQTDLVGPINFKTLMETGRTEHFTDEGMLGAVHAFLDEVFDGRDMLLRSTLNVLQERELKQGTKTTRGQIECALMTTNRYLAEVLESSRETLLAFVDRIAFVSFVPKGFADPANLSMVLRKQVGGTGTPRLCEALTIQDLDVLQAAAEEVYVPDAVCDGLGALLGMLEQEFAAAASSTSSRSMSTPSAPQISSGTTVRSTAACSTSRSWIVSVACSARPRVPPTCVRSTFPRLSADANPFGTKLTNATRSTNASSVSRELSSTSARYRFVVMSAHSMRPRVVFAPCFSSRSCSTLSVVRRSMSRPSSTSSRKACTAPSMPSSVKCSVRPVSMSVLKLIGPTRSVWTVLSVN